MPKVLCGLDVIFDDEGAFPKAIASNRVSIVGAGVDQVKAPTNDGPGEWNPNSEVMDACPQPLATICHAL